MIKNPQPGMLVRSGNSYAIAAYVPLRDSDGNDVGFLRPGGIGMIVATRGSTCDVLLLWPDGLGYVAPTLLVVA